MKTKIILMNALDYSSEGKEGTRIEYYLVDEKLVSNNEKFKGYTQINGFYNSRYPFSVITPEMLKKEVDGIFSTKQDYKNPLKTTMVLEGFVYNGRTIDLVQSKN